MKKKRLPPDRITRISQVLELPLRVVKENLAMPLPGEFAVRSGSGNLLFLAPRRRQGAVIN